MKKLLVLLALCMVLAVVFVACEQPETPVEDTTAGTTEAPTTQAPETEAPTTQAPTTQAPETEAPTTQAPETEPPTTETNPPETTEPPVVIDPVKVGMSFDQLYTGNGPATAGEENFFTPGQSASWDGKAVIEDYNIDYVTVWGWVAFFAETPATFGYQIGDAEPVFDAAFTVEAEQPVVDAATSMGGKSAARMHISVPVLYVGGEDIVIKALAKDAVGTVETLVEFTLTKAENPNAPAFVLDAAALSNAATNGFSPNMISSAVLSADGSYFTITSTDGGDPYFYPMSPGDTVVDKGAQYVVIKYRTTYDGEGKGGEFFVGSGAGPTGGADEARFEYVADGKWNLVIVDLSTVSTVNEAFDLNYLRYDFYLGAKNTSIDIGYIAAFQSVEAALAYDAKFVDVYYNTMTIPQDAWTVTGHKEGITPAEDPSHGPMVAAGGIATGALLHQGYISIGELNLAQFSKLIVYIGIDNSQVTLDHHAANAANRLILTSADQAMTMSPTDDVVIASVDYAPCGWAVTAFEIDLTGVDYNGPVYFTYDTLPGTFMLVGSIELVYDPNYVEPEAPVVETLVVNMDNEANASFKRDTAQAVFGFEGSFWQLGYNNQLTLGTIDLSQYSKAEIVYSHGAPENVFNATPSHAIGFKSSATAYGWETNEPNFTDDIAHVDMTWDGNGNSAAGMKTAVLDLTEVDYNGEVFLCVYNPQGTVIPVISITLIP